MIGTIALCIAVVALAFASFACFILGKLVALFKEMADDLLEWAKEAEADAIRERDATIATIRSGARSTTHRFKL